MRKRSFYAHSSNKSGSSWEPLREHVRCVAQRARENAVVFDAQQEAEIAGLWHDLGKYSELFIKRLSGKESGLDHWSAGALAALACFKDKAVAAGLAIQGHHIGLQEGSAPGIKESLDIFRLSSPDTHPFGLRLTETDYKELIERFLSDGYTMPSPPEHSLYDFNDPMYCSAMLDARMIFSALVDADYLETEAYFEGKSDGTKVYRPEGPLLRAKEAFKIITERLDELDRTSSASHQVRQMRKNLRKSCLNKADSSHGIFTLTAPTGAGKTLAMLALALKRAIINPDIRRIIMVVPFLSIIEQTAKVYRNLFEPHFGPYYVLEHHSLAGSKAGKEQKFKNKEEESRRIACLLAENWDAPLIVTTSVQFFESLFANSPGQCRKLHRIANSIILFDEVQTFPPRIAVPSLAALSRLRERYGCSVVFSTATQPAFDHLHNQVKKFTALGWQPRAIIEEPLSLFAHARRVRIDWRINENRSWQSVADELAGDENFRSLCVVNLKRHAQKLVELLRERCKEDGLFHLSTNMCPVHREKVLAAVRNRLDEKSPCRLIATQCIEAGADVDFPVVFRAFGPLDSIAQAAGRCNREGKLNDQGRMIIFLPEKEHNKEYLYPPGGYKEAVETTKTLFEQKRNEALEKGSSIEQKFDIYNQGLFNQYYRMLYDLTGAAAINSGLEDALKRRSFVDVARYYKLIADGAINILVPYEAEKKRFYSLKDGWLTRQWIREARPITVSLYRPKRGAVVWNYLKPVPLINSEPSEGWFVYLNEKDYDPMFGIKPPDEVRAWMV